MSWLQKNHPFLIVVLDHDQNKFNVLGPMADDTCITNKVYMCQDSGREVNCFTENGHSTKEQVIYSVKLQFRYEFSKSLLL